MARREIEFPKITPAPEREPGFIPSVVIVGRPNVGKSSLLNCLARKRIAIVDPTAGVTRDRISAFVEHEGRLFELWDTGGIGTPDDLAAEVETQIETALTRADLVLFVVDAQDGLTPLDRDIASRIRRIDRPVVLVVNKVEHAKHSQEATAEFTRLGFDPAVNVSAMHSYGRSDLLAAIVARLPAHHAVAGEPVLKLAIVGRQNVGKSTLINTLVGEKRVIVSDLPGTTRDAVDVRFERNGQVFLAVDTAGIKRKTRVADSIEFYSIARAQRAIRRCDVALLMVDVTAEISRIDKELASAIEAEARPCAIVVNKWDLGYGKFTPEEYVEYLNTRLHNLAYAPVVFTSGRDNLHVDEALKVAQGLFEQSRKPVGTGQLNAAIQAAEAQRAPEGSHGKHPRLFYATQIGVAPPTFLIFASHPQLISDQYTRYLSGFLREALDYREVPLRIIYRARTRKSDEREP